MIWDRICRPGEKEDPLETWGGISYSLEALSVALPEGWTVRPILRLGEDLYEDALAYLSSIPGLEIQSGIQVTPGENPQVELRYQDRETRLEVPSGAVPPWTWDDLQPRVETVDAIYVNFITGRELDLDTAHALGDSFPGPLYADLHTLFAEISTSGIRYPRSLPTWREWFQAFDLIQVNEEEFHLIAGPGDDAWERAATVIGRRPALVAVTMGPRGSTYISHEDFDPDPASWAIRRRLTEGGDANPKKAVSASTEVVSGDPTGCGDVWGATFFARLLAGEGTEEAMASANRQAAENIKHRGAPGLHRRLPAFPTGR
jgi:hypothetical protein